MLFFIRCDRLIFDKCEVNNIKVGEEYLMPVTKIFLEQFVDKKIVFVDTLGNELKFTEQNGLQREIRTSQVRLNCNQGFFEEDKSYDYIEYEWISILLIDTVENLAILYTGRMIDRDASIRYPVFYDDLNPVMYVPGTTCCSMSTLLIMSMRDNVNQPVIAPDPPIILDTIILNKHFSNIYKRKRNGLCCGGLQPESNLPNEFYISKKDGIIAFRMLNGKLWRFERME